MAMVQQPQGERMRCLKSHGQRPWGILNRLNSDLQNSRMWPVKLAHLKHQDALCQSFKGHADELERSFLQLTQKTANGNKEFVGADLDALTAACELAQQRMKLYQEDAVEAQTLTRASRAGAKAKAGASRAAK